MIAIHFRAAQSAAAQSLLATLTGRYGQTTLDHATHVVALGGDGFMLETLHALAARNLPIYGIKAGSVGFLLNSLHPDDLPARLAAAQRISLHPLQMLINDERERRWPAYNEVSLLRQSHQAAKIKISIDGVVRLPELVADGILVATAAGSTAYNFSAHGPILPLTANLLALTPISAFRPRRWRGALLPHSCQIVFEMLEADKRPVNAVADFAEVRNVTRVAVQQDMSQSITLLFDPDQNLAERIIREQFES